LVFEFSGCAADYPDYHRFGFDFYAGILVVLPFLQPPARLLLI